MTRRFVVVVAVLTWSCQPKPSAPASKDAAPAPTPDAVAPTAAVKNETISALADIAAQCAAVDGGAPGVDPLAGCAPWRSLAPEAARDIERYNARVSEAGHRAHGRLRAAAARLGAESSVERLAARRILVTGLKRLLYEKNDDDAPYRAALLARVDALGGGDDAERVELIRLFGNYPDEALAARLVELAGHDRLAIRRAAIRALSHCAPRTCQVDRETMGRWYAAAKSAESVEREALVMLAGKLRHHDIVEWCATGDRLTVGCRKGLAHLETPEAFSIVARDIEQGLKAAEIAVPAPADGTLPAPPVVAAPELRDVTEALILAFSFARMPAARPTLIGLVDRALHLTRRDPRFFTVLVDSLERLQSIPEIGRLAVAHHGRLEAAGWPKALPTAYVHAFTALEKAITAFGLGAVIGADADDGHGH